MKLYRVTLQGFYDKPIGCCMVVASDPTAAYSIVREYLDRKNYGFDKDRELKSVELLADDTDYPDTPHKLFVGR